MSLFSRLLRRDYPDGEGPPPGQAEVDPNIVTNAATKPAGAVPTAEYPAHAEETDASQLSGADDPTPPPPPPAATAPLIARPGPPLITAAAVDEAFRNLVAPAERGASTAQSPAAQAPAAQAPAARAADRAADQAAVRATFEELAVGHVAPLRNLMLEVRWGEAQVRWIELARPALKSLRAMAAQIELSDLVSALDEFGAGLDRAAKTGGASVTGAEREALLAAYLPLCRKLARAFAIDGERDRREPLIVESLLRQVPGLDPLLLLKLSAVGLSRLENLMRASADEIACVAGVPQAVAAAVVDQVGEFQRSTPVALAGEGIAARRTLEPLVIRLAAENDTFERVVNGWSAEEVATRRRVRRERERAYLAVKAALARLGEVDLVLELEKLPFGARVEQLVQFLHPGENDGARPPTTPPKTNMGGSNGNKEGAGHGRAHA
jgi:hypothetical protein